MFRYNLIEELSSSIRNTEFGISSATVSLFIKPVNVCLNVANGKNGLMIIASDEADAARKLSVVKNNLDNNRPLRFALTDKIFTSKLENKPGKIAFLFPGFGSEYPEMFDGLFEHFPFVSKWLEVLRDVMVGMESYANVTNEVIAKVSEGLAKGIYATNNRGIISIVNSLTSYHIISALGLRIDGMVGHSNGENAALTAAGVFESEDIEGLVSTLRTMMGITELSVNERCGQYLSVSNFSLEQIKELLLSFENQAFLAMKNCTNQNIVFVKEEVKEPVSKLIFEKRGIVLPMVAENPFHTPLFRAKTEVIKKIYSTMKIGPGSIPVYSCVDSMPIEGDVDAIVDKATRQWTETVQFTDTINKMHGDGFNIFIEVGPNSKLTNFVKDILKGKNIVAISGSVAGKDTMETMLQLAGTLWINGVSVDFSVFETGNIVEDQPAPVHTNIQKEKSSQVVTAGLRASILDSHQQLMRLFIEVQESSLMKFKNAYSSSRVTLKEIVSQPRPFKAEDWPLLSKPMVQTGEKLYLERHYDLRTERFFGDHAFGKKLAVVAYTVSLEILAEAAALLLGAGWEVVSVRDSIGHHWLVFDRDYLDIGVSAELVSRSNQGVNDLKEVLVTIYSLDKKTGKKTKAFDGKVQLEKKYRAAPASVSNRPLITNPPVKNVVNYSRDFFFHGKYFLAIKKITGLDASGLTAILSVPTLNGAFDHMQNPVLRVSGAFLDSCGQLAAFWLADNGFEDFSVFPFKIDQYEQFREFPAEGELIECRAIVSKNLATVTGDFFFYNEGGEIIAHMKGFQLRYYKNNWIPRLLMNRLTLDEMDDLTPEFLEQSGAIWGRILAKLILDESEYEDWLSMPQTEGKRTEVLLDKMQLIKV